MDYYNGEVGELFVSEATKRALREAGSDFDANFAKRVVDAVLDKLRIVSVIVAGENKESSERLTTILMDEVWTPNRLDLHSKTYNRGALGQGDAYGIVWPDRDGKPAVHYNGPETTRVFYDEEDPRLKAYAAKCWKIGYKSESEDTTQTRVNLYYSDRIERYVSRIGTKGEHESDFEQYLGDGQEWPIDNPYGVVPVFHFRTDAPYGTPEHKEAYGPQNSITKLIVSSMATVDYTAFPQRYTLQDADRMTGMAGSTVDWGDDDETQAPGDTSNLRAGPGQLWDLYGKSVGQFDAADPDAFLKPLAFQIKAMSSITVTPLHYFDPTGQRPSGDARRAEDGPFTDRVDDRKRWLETTWSEMLAFAMEVAGHKGVSVDVVWKPSIEVDDLEGWQTVQAKQASGVPVGQTLIESGYDTDVVESWQEGSQATSIATRVALLKEVATATQALGAAQSMGAINEEMAAKIIQGILGDILPEEDMPEGTPVFEVAPPAVPDPAQDDEAVSDDRADPE